MPDITKDFFRVSEDFHEDESEDDTDTDESSSCSSDDEYYAPGEKARLKREIRLLNEQIKEIETADLVSELLDLEEISDNLEDDVERLNRVYTRLVDNREPLEGADEEEDDGDDGGSFKRGRINQIDL